MPDSLHDHLGKGYDFLEGGRGHYKQLVPSCIKTNLNPRFHLRPYQLEAFGRFKYYMEDYESKDFPLRVLFHMATGSGKTLIMAGLILYLYERGYRNFLFFVNRDNIIRQTRNIFLNPGASKFLFNESLSLNGHEVSVAEVKSFGPEHTHDIRIMFTTVQGLHSRLNGPRENSISYEDFENLKMVLISDEAHHINVKTKRGLQTSLSLLDDPNWEETINRIHQLNLKSILLEFTATMDFENRWIRDKYSDKVIFDYPLKKFRQDKYSKEVRVLQSDSKLFDRTLQAMMISQYRRKIFNKYGINCKPVILFKSETINKSKSFQEDFHKRLKSLKEEDLGPLLVCEGPSPLSELREYLRANSITLESLAEELKEDFAESRCISVNSKSESEQKQIDVNTLEDIRNMFRAVFAVNKLDEGWDVLNLFDIVRLYDKRDGKNNRPGKTTMAEAQLIGRGARYYPFQVNGEQAEAQRKYDVVDSDEDRELQLCEVLYYHSAYNPRYISELKTALTETGILPDEYSQKELLLKPTFKRSSFYKTGYVYKNRKVQNDRRKIKGIGSSFVNSTHQFQLNTGETRSLLIFDENVTRKSATGCRKYALNSFGSHIIKKAINRIPAFRFNRLKEWYPQLRSVSELITSDHYLGKVELEVRGAEEQVNNLSQDDKLFLGTSVLKKLADHLEKENTTHKGTRDFHPHKIKNVFIDKTLNFSIESGTQECGKSQNETTNSDLRIDLSDEEWFVFNECYGTSEEKYFVKYIHEVMPELKQKYQNIYLFRNERHLKIFNFDDGRAFEPDFILFLLDESCKRGMQVFIEPKGGHLIDQDKWKEDLLKKLYQAHCVKKLEHRGYVLWGLPFFNNEQNAKFNDAFQKQILKHP